MEIYNHMTADDKQNTITDICFNENLKFKLQVPCTSKITNITSF